jgi:hypothetical protein
MKLIDLLIKDEDYNLDIFGQTTSASELVKKIVNRELFFLNGTK